MAVYYKFKSGKEFNSIAIDGHFITVGELKQKIFETKFFGGSRRNADRLLVTLAHQKDDAEYLDEAAMVPKSTSVIVTRVSGRLHMMNIVPRPPIEPMEEKKHVVESEPTKNTDDTEWDDFGDDLYAIPEIPPMKSSSATPSPPSKAEEDRKIRALIETPALGCWQPQGPEGFGAGRGLGSRGTGCRTVNGHGFGPATTPPQGYICRRCKIAGHFIQHCETNGDPAYDIKRVKNPTGIPKSMLMASEEGSYTLPSGEVAVLRPNETAFEKEIEGLLPSTRSAVELPPEFHCPLCKQAMKDAILTSKCCFRSFCDKCIRDFIISKKRCVCDSTNVLADDLVPNKTVRDTIKHRQEESVRPRPKISSSALSAASKGQSAPPPRSEQIPQRTDIANAGYAAAAASAGAPQKIAGNEMIVKNADVSETTHDSKKRRAAAGYDPHWNDVQYGTEDPLTTAPPSSGPMPPFPGCYMPAFPGMMMPQYDQFAAHRHMNMLLHQNYSGAAAERGYSVTNPSKSSLQFNHISSSPDLKKRKVSYSSSDSAAPLLSSSSQRHGHRTSSRTKTSMLNRAGATM